MKEEERQRQPLQVREVRLFALLVHDVAGATDGQQVAERADADTIPKSSPSAACVAADSWACW